MQGVIRALSKSGYYKCNVFYVVKVWNHAEENVASVFKIQHLYLSHPLIRVKPFNLENTED